MSGSLIICKFLGSRRFFTVIIQGTSLFIGKQTKPKSIKSKIKEKKMLFLITKTKETKNNKEKL